MDTMSRARFAVQVSVVLTLVALVSWPEQRQLRANPFWGSAPVETSGPTTRGGDPRFPEEPSDGRQRQIGFGRASYISAPAAPGIPNLDQKLAENVYENRRSLLPPEMLALGATINAIVGYTRTSANEAIPFARVWLRNVRTGEIEARAVADQFGQFLFLDIRPTGYVVEVIGPDGTVIAASALVSIGTGDLRQTTLFVPIGGPRPTTPPAATAGAAQMINTAVATGVSRVGQPERAVSPQR
jgi:hypothetical protein